MMNAWNVLEDFFGQYLHIDRWFYLGFSGAGVSGVGAFALDHGPKLVTIIGGIIMVAVSVWQKVKANNRAEKDFEADQEMKRLKFQQEMKQDEEKHQKDLSEQ